MYAPVMEKGVVSVWTDYRLNGRRETVCLGHDGPGGLSPARAREKCIDARRIPAEGVSPAIGKQRNRRCLREAKSSGRLREK
ncbi:hypothetical protein [Komagataeibacter intermedius]|uniref:hypothetical protein n=2 Tax=Komagataeibacter intermedius TaxID=66229 RepID=UPI00357142F1